MASEKVEKLAEEVRKLSPAGQFFIKSLLEMMHADDKYEYRIAHDVSDRGEQYLLMKYDKKLNKQYVIDDVWIPKNVADER